MDLKYRSESILGTKLFTFLHIYMILAKIAVLPIAGTLGQRVLYSLKRVVYNFFLLNT